MAMEPTLNNVGGSESPIPLLEQLAEVFGKLKSHTEASLQLQNGMQWEDIKEHFLNLDKSYRSKFDELVEKQKALEEKKAEACRLIAEKEANVSAKERASVNQLQELRDAAVSSLAEVRRKYKVELAEILDANGSKDKKVSTSTNDNNASRASEETTPASGLGELPEASPVETKPRPVLKQLCEQMDMKGLLKFLSENIKKLASFRDELSVALRCATDPARLVLDSLEGFFPPDQTNSPGNKNNALQVHRRSCIVLMEAIAPALGTKEPGGNEPWSSEIKEQAKAVAEEWKSKLAEIDLDASNGYSMEAQAFLQLLTTFNLDSVLDEDELCKIVVAISRRKQTAVSCRALGLNERIPGIIEELVKRHRQIDAIHFIQAFGLSETFPPAPLLKTYVEELKDSLENNLDTNTSLSKDDPKSRELLALRAVIKCIEEYKLQKECSLGPLQKRVCELKPKGEKRPSFDAGRTHAKKPRGSGISFHRRPAGPVGSAARRPVFPVGNWQHAPAPMPSCAPAPMPPLPDRYGVAELYHYTPPAAAYDAGAFPSYGEPFSALKPFQYTPGSVAASYSSDQYEVAYGGSGQYAGYAGPTGSSASSNYMAADTSEEEEEAGDGAEEGHEDELELLSSPVTSGSRKWGSSTNTIAASPSKKSKSLVVRLIHSMINHSEKVQNQRLEILKRQVQFQMLQEEKKAKKQEEYITQFREMRALAVEDGIRRGSAEYVALVRIFKDLTMRDMWWDCKTSEERVEFVRNYINNEYE